MELTREQTSALDSAGLYSLVLADKVPHGTINEAYLTRLMQIAQSMKTIKSGLKEAPEWMSPSGARTDIKRLLAGFGKQFSLSDALVGMAISEAEIAVGIPS